MYIRTFLSVVFICFSGCVNMIHELKSDPAIVGITGFWVQVGVEASPSSGGVPFPTLKFGHGTIWRVGITDEATISVGETFGPEAPENATKSSGTKGQASLRITTKGTAKALAKMEELDQKNAAKAATKTGP